MTWPIREGLLQFLEIQKEQAAEAHFRATMLWVQAGKKGSKPPEIPHVLKP